MAFKKKPAPEVAGLFRASATFIHNGTLMVSVGDVAEAGHPILKGREHLFEPLVPRFSLSSAEPADEPADAPAVELAAEPEAEPAEPA
jgi:hypothetical protein